MGRRGLYLHGYQQDSMNDACEHDDEYTGSDDRDGRSRIV